MISELQKIISESPVILLASFATSLLANIITIVSLFRIFRKREKKPYNLGFFRKITLEYRLKNAYKKNDKEEVSLCLKYINWVKLYSKDTSEQEAAISQIYHSNDDTEQKLLIFLDRLGHKPELSYAVKTLLIKQIKELSKKL